MSIFISLKEWREAEGLKQAKAAKRLKIEQGTLSRYETGKSPIPPEKAIEFEKITGVSRSFLRPDLWEDGHAPAN